MRYFELGNAVSQDDCATQMRNIGNNSIFDYRVDNPIRVHDKPCKTDLFVENPNLRYRDGYGNTPKEKVDADSELRLEDPDQIRGPDRQQLFVRTFKAVPDLSSGTFVPNVESQLIHSHDTFVDRGCTSLTEVYYDRNHIFTPCINDYVHGYSRAVPYEPRTGIPSRDLKQCPKQPIPLVGKQFERINKLTGRFCKCDE